MTEKRIPYFKRFVLQNFPFIEADFDALTNYQLYCKVVEYLNTVINSQNEVTEQMQYVLNFFNNLDVQDEINNKLDQMAKSGELTDLIAGYLNLRGILAYNTVADMKAADNLVDGSFAETYGFYTKGDAGGAKYKVRKVTNSDVIDEWSLIALADESLVAELMIGATLNSKQAGCYGDGIHDDSDRLEQLMNKQAINIEVVKGTYLITRKIVVNGTWHNKSNTLKPVINFNNAMIKYAGEEGKCSILFINMFSYQINNLAIDLNGVQNYIAVYACYNTVFNSPRTWDILVTHNPDIKGDITTNADGTQHIQFRDGILGNVTIDSDSSYTGGYVNGIYFNNCQFGLGIHGLNPVNNVHISGNKFKNQINFTNCDFSYATESVFKIDQQTPIVGNMSGLAVHCIGCYFDTAVPTSNAFLGSISLINCHFSQSGSAIQNPTLSYNDFTRSTQIESGYLFADFIPFGNENLIKNGNIESNTYQETNGAYIFGIGNATITKSYVTNVKNRFKNARKLSYTNGGTLKFSAINLPHDGRYVYGIRFVITNKPTGISENATIDIAAGGFSNSYKVSNFEVGKEYIITTTKGLVLSAGQSVEPSIYIRGTDFFPEGSTGSFDIEILEAILSPGTILMPNTAMHVDAIIA